MREYAPYARFVVIPAAPHMLFIEQPWLVTAALFDWTLIA
jgi:pimeloyl-ACP methyl ester carboxylesterase